MNISKHTLLLSLLFVFSFQANAFEYDLTSICKHPQRDLLYVSGEFNTILVVDSNTGEVKDQFDTDYSVYQMQFEPNGMHMLVSGNDNSIHFLNPDTGEETKSVQGSAFQLLEEAPYFLDVSWMDNSVIVYDAKNGNAVTTAKVDFEPLGAGLSSDFSELLVLGRDKDIENEQELIEITVEDTDGYNPFRKTYIEQQTDGEGADFAVFNIASEQFVQQWTLPYTTHKNFDLTIGSYQNGYLLGCWDIMIHVSKEGRCTPIIPEESSFTYASSLSSDGKYLFLSSSEDGNIYDASNKTVKHFNAAEDFMAPITADISISGKTAYLLSENYNVIQLDMNGTQTKQFKIEDGLTNGFGLFYYNGGDAGEEQDLEGVIINEVRASYGWDVIHLEQTENGEYVQIGTFNTLKEVYEMKEKLDDKDLSYEVDYAPLPKQISD